MTIDFKRFRIGVRCAMLAVAGPAFVSQAMAAANVDTGIGRTQCYAKGSNTLVDCAASRLPGQDGGTGADATPGENDEDDGDLGFSYRKICNSGQPSGEGSCPPDPPLGEGYDDWACTLDRRTGMIWEVKTKSGLRGMLNRYTNYSPDHDPEGAYRSATDATGYADAVNRRGLCGASDWGLEHAERVQLLLHYGLPRSAAPRIDPRFFPNTLAEPYWNASHNPDSVRAAWTVDFLSGAVLNTTDRSLRRPVRLARGKRQLGFPPGSGRFISADGTQVEFVFPGQTNTWQRCVVGTTWNGEGCAGSPSAFTHEEALRYAARVAAGTQLAWRVPNAKDLAGISSRGEGGVDSETFPDTPPAPQWSSTPDVDDPSKAWTIDFASGSSASANRQKKLYLRLLRD